jgi:serine/threonine protein kinase
VYRGTLKGKPVAVKVIETAGDQVPSKIMNELQLVIQLQHPNIVQALHVAMWQRPHARQSLTGLAALTGGGPSSSNSCAGHGCSSTGRSSSSSNSGCCVLPLQHGSCSSSSSSSSGLVKSLSLKGCTTGNHCSSFSSNSSGGLFQSLEPARTHGLAGAGEDAVGDSLKQHGESVGDLEAEGADCKAWIVLEYCEGGTFEEAIMRGLYHDDLGQPQMVSVEAIGGFGRGQTAGSCTTVERFRGTFHSIICRVGSVML